MCGIYLFRCRPTSSMLGPLRKLCRALKAIPGQKRSYSDVLFGNGPSVTSHAAFLDYCPPAAWELLDVEFANTQMQILCEDCSGSFLPLLYYRYHLCYPSFRRPRADLSFARRSILTPSVVQ
jgi:hypothetical protein